MIALYIYLAALNLFDGIVTSIGVRGGEIEEYNPFMGFLLMKDASLFLFVKIGLSILLIMICLQLRNIAISKFFQYLVLFSTLLYSSVTIIHFYWIYLLYI